MRVCGMCVYAVRTMCGGVCVCGVCRVLCVCMFIYVCVCICRLERLLPVFPWLLFSSSFSTGKSFANRFGQPSYPVCPRDPVSAFSELGLLAGYHASSAFSWVLGI